MINERHKHLIYLTKLISAISVVAFFASSSCKKKKEVPPPEAEPEVITTLKIMLTDSLTGTSSTWFFGDPDGEGGQPGFYGPDRASQTDSVITLQSHRTYFGSIMLLDETKSPVEDLTGEVSELGGEHMIFYNHGNNVITSAANPYTVKLNGSNVLVTYRDYDNSGHPVGLETRWRTADSTAPRQLLKITLRHQPDGKNGTYEIGDTDVEVNFKLTVNG